MTTNSGTLTRQEQKTYLLELMQLYVDTAKTFTQISVGALILPIVFARQILALDPTKPLRADPLLVLVWCLFLAAIGSGLCYQYLAVKYLTVSYWREERKGSSWFVRQPGYVYGVMMVTFFAAASLFVLRAYLQFAR